MKLLSIILALSTFGSTYHKEMPLSSESLRYKAHIKHIKKKPLILPEFQARTNVYETSKQNYLERAKYSRDDANYELNECLKYVNYIPNLDLRAQINTLITATIGSFSVPFVKDKFHLVFLALLGQATAQITLDIYDNYQLLKKHGAAAAISLEECNCFLSLALSAEVYHHPNIDYDTYYYDLSEEMDETIQYLIIAEMHATSMNRPQDFMAITDQCYLVKKKMMAEIQRHGRITTMHTPAIKKMMDDALLLLKTASEDRETINTILSLLHDACRRLKIVEANIFN